MRCRAAAGFPAAAPVTWLFRFCIVQRILNELDEELLLLEVVCCQILSKSIGQRNLVECNCFIRNCRVILCKTYKCDIKLFVTVKILICKEIIFAAEI